MRNLGTSMKIVGVFLVLIGLAGTVWVSYYYFGIGDEDGVIYTEDYWSDMSNWRKSGIIYNNFMPFAIVGAGVALWVIGDTLDRFEIERMESREPRSQREMKPERSTAESRGRTNYCPNCGVKVEPGDKFCLKCGEKLS